MNPNHSATAGAAVLVAAALIGGCTSGPRYQTTSIGESSYDARVYAAEYGVVDSIQLVRGGTAGGTTGVGAVAGGVVGGLIGNEIGSGSGRTAATIAGAVGGAAVGNEGERQNRARERDLYQIGIRLQNGGYLTVTQDTPADLRVGDRVRVENGQARRY